MKRLYTILALMVLTACGLSDNEQDEKNKYIYITFVDSAFEAYCIGEFDLNGDGRISRYEAQRALRMNCSGRGIGQMWEIGEFSRLQRLDCSGNALTQLDLRDCKQLSVLNCSHNNIASLDVRDLRSLTDLNCQDNAVATLNLGNADGLLTINFRNNDLSSTLDLRKYSTSLSADLRGNPSLATVYCYLSQSVSIDGNTQIIAQ
ncbi:leucine-rich repeat domain-containing protein [uncultured Alistipes sp.]|uniref:leucine-rich repeat domain-containing protein n=1 Tax=uncultured Alistipes sp. TaxID=538949 RepID=UPI0025EBBDED|nr:leucine-rich repeat domain-containing protein [uncultured Alistipes sp.]